MNKYLPSKKFVKFIGAVILVAAIVWVVSMFVSKKQVFTAKHSDEVLAATSDDANNLYKQDSDGDGVYDWEEGLWGTDPRSKDSNNDGVTDDHDIEARKKDIQDKNDLNPEANASEDIPNQTEAFARQLLSTASLVNQQGGLTSSSMEAFSKSLDNSLAQVAIPDQYTLVDLKLSNVAPAAYKASLAKAFDPYRKAGISESSVIYRLANGDLTVESDMDKLVEIYAKLSKDLLAVETPHTIAGTQLVLANSAAKLSAMFINLKQLQSDPLAAVAGFEGYKKYSTEMEQAIIRLTEYFRSSGV